MTEQKKARRRAQRGSRLSAGVVVVRPDGDEWLFLLLRAFRYWDFPKGMMEPGETPMQAALREVKEETGFDISFLEQGIGLLRGINTSITPNSVSIPKDSGVTSTNTISFLLIVIL